MDRSLLMLSHQIDITQLVSRFGMMVDARNWTGFQALFADPVDFDYSDIEDVAETLHPKEVANNAKKSFEGFKATQHVITNHQVSVTEKETATCEAYVRAIHTLPNDEGDSLLEIGGKYNADLVYLDGQWKIKSWKFSMIWSRGKEDLFSLAKEQRKQP